MAVYGKPITELRRVTCLWNCTFEVTTTL